MTKLTRQASITLDKDDMAAILTEAVCSYNCFAGLRVAYISQNSDGDFDLTLEPLPVDEARDAN